MTIDVLLPIVTFAVVYGVISFELVNKSVAALSGLLLLIVCRVLTLEEAMALVNFETIMLLMGMMIIVSQMKASGGFALLAVKIAQITKGRPVAILILFSIVTSILSAILDNVTTVLIIVPIVIELTVGLGLNPRVYVISQALISNFAGTATLIGDPPNIMIGSMVGLSFNQFLVNLLPVVCVVIAACLLYIWVVNRAEVRPIDSSLSKLFSVQLLLAKIQQEFQSVSFDRKLVINSVVCLVVAILLFMTQRITHLSPGVVAVAVAMVLVILSRRDVAHALQDLEWDTLLFFAGLFVLVGALEKKGVIEWIAHTIFLRLGDNPYVIVVSVLWISAIVSGILDNIPFTATMIPIVRVLLERTPIPNDILWWSLSLGVCFGGNFTYIGASANIVSVGLAKKLGHKITFVEFMKTGVPTTIIALLISTVYLCIYLRLSL